MVFDRSAREKAKGEMVSECSRGMSTFVANARPTPPTHARQARDTAGQQCRASPISMKAQREAVETHGRSTETPWDDAIGARYRGTASRAREAVAWDVHFVRREEHGRQHRGMRCSSMDAGRGSTPRKAIATRTPRARREAAAEAWRAAHSCVRAWHLAKKSAGGECGHAGGEFGCKGRVSTHNEKHSVGRLKTSGFLLGCVVIRY